MNEEQARLFVVHGYGKGFVQDTELPLYMTRFGDLTHAKFYRREQDAKSAITHIVRANRKVKREDLAVYMVGLTIVGGGLE